MISRRAAILGIAGGVLAGIRRSQAEDAKQAPTAKTSGAEHIDHHDWARELAVGDLGSLLSSTTGFIAQAHRSSDDPIVLEGIARIARHTVEHPRHEDARKHAVLILGFVEATPAERPSLAHYAPQLQRIAR